MSICSLVDPLLPWDSKEAMALYILGPDKRDEKVSRRLVVV